MRGFLMTLQEEVFQLAKLVPGPPNEPLPAGISDADIDLFTEKTGLPVPTELRAWLLFTNGPCIGPGGIYGIRPKRNHLDIECTYEHLPEFKENRWIPIGSDGCGDYYVIALAPHHQSVESVEPVYFIDLHLKNCFAKPTYVAASGFMRFLRFLFREELGLGSGWPFDEKPVLENDPDLSKCTGAVMPWEAD
jgi:SMI1 / KNR4 family (SUKH-1)